MEIGIPSKKELEETYQKLTRTNRLIETEIEKIEGNESVQQSTPPLVLGAYKDAKSALDKATPAFEKVKDSINEIQDIVLKPVTNLIDNNSRKSSILGLLGLVVGLAGIAASIYSNVTTKTISSELNPEINTTTNDFYGQIAEELRNTSFDSKVKIFNTQMESVSSSTKEDNYRIIKEKFSEQFSNTDLKSLDAEQKDQAILNWIIVEFNNPSFEDNKGFRDELLIYLEELNQSSNERVLNTAKWLISEIYIYNKEFSISQNYLDGIRGNEDFKVFDTKERKFNNIQDLINVRKQNIKELLIKEKVKIILLNETVPRISNFAEEQKKKLLSYGYKSENIICLTGNEASTIFGYYGDLDSKKELEKIIKLLYSNPQKMGVDLTKIDNAIVSEIKRIYKKYDADIVLRLPIDEK